MSSAKRGTDYSVASGEQEPKKKKTVRTTITTVTTIETEEELFDSDSKRTTKHREVFSSDGHSAQDLLVTHLQALQHQIQNIPKEKGDGSQIGKAVPNSGIPSKSPTPSTSIPPLNYGSSSSNSSSASVSQRQTTSQYPPAPIPKDSVILEKGHIYFFYRPRVAVAEVQDFNDVQKMFFILKAMTPKSTFSKSSPMPIYRLFRIGKKKLPSTSEHNRFWAIIEEASIDLTKIQALLSSDSYSTITQGERTVSACRPAGQGFYAIVQSRDSTHLAYVLELPQEIGVVQRAFNIDNEGSYFLAVKNPMLDNTSQQRQTSSGTSIPTKSSQGGSSTAPGIVCSQQNDSGLPNPNVSRAVPQSLIQVVYPKEIQDSFRGRRFAPAMPIQMLDYKGTEVVLIGESNNLVKVFGQTGQEIEEEEKIDAHFLEDHNLFSELRISIDEYPIEPLLFGQWK